jgi:internalin A
MRPGYEDRQKASYPSTPERGHASQSLYGGPEPSKAHATTASRSRRSTLRRANLPSAIICLSEIGYVKPEKPGNKPTSGQKHATRVRDSGPAGTEIQRIRKEALARIRSLRASEVRNLDLNNSYLGAFPSELLGFNNLQHLSLANNRLPYVPPEIGNLANLKFLDLADNYLTHLPPDLAKLANLQFLDLTCNRLVYLPPEIASLTNLELLSLSSNNIKTIPPEFGRLRESIDLRLDRNPLDDSLSMMAARGTSALFAYLRGILNAGRPQYEAKALLVGEGNVGKSSLVARLRGEEFVENRPTTHGIEIGRLFLPHPDATLRLSGVELTLNTWDFGGQEVYRITHQFFFSRRAVYLLVWRPREGKDENAIEAWCMRMRLRIGQDAKIIIVATHADERRPELDYPFLKRRFGDLIIAQHAVDNYTGSGIDDLRATIAHAAAGLPQMGDPMSTYWQATRDELSLIDDPQISYDRFARICARNGLDNKETQAFAGLLHELGHIIHYADDDGLRDIIVLQPEWLTKAIGYILEDGSTEHEGGVLDHRRLRALWQDPTRDTQYASVYHPYFLRLMEKFDVSYRIPDEDKSLVAQLVPYEEPPLPWRHYSDVLDGRRSLSMVCQMTEAAPGLIAWLTVRNHRFSTGRHWRRGVFLEHREHAAEALFTLDDDRELVLTVRAQSPDYLFSILRDTVEDLIARRWHGLAYKLLIPCPGMRPDGSSCPGRFALDTLERWRERNRLTIDCHECDEPQSVTELLTGFKGPEAPITQVLAAVEKHTEELKAEIRQQAASITTDYRDLAAAHAAETANQLRTLLRVVSTELPGCPRLFTLVPRRKRRKERIDSTREYWRLTLWCEHPGHEHPWLAAKYEFAQPKEWFRTVAPYIVMISNLLRFVVPIAGAGIEAALPQDRRQTVQADLNLMTTVAEKALPAKLHSDSADVWRLMGAKAEGATLRGLRALLVSLDPAMIFGDLRQVLSPSGDVLWVCPQYHYQEYDPGIPRLPS